MVKQSFLYRPVQAKVDFLLSKRVYFSLNRSVHLDIGLKLISFHTLIQIEKFSDFHPVDE